MKKILCFVSFFLLIVTTKGQVPQIRKESNTVPQRQTTTPKTTSTDNAQPSQKECVPKASVLKTGPKIYEMNFTALCSQRDIDLFATNDFLTITEAGTYLIIIETVSWGGVNHEGPCNATLPGYYAYDKSGFAFLYDVTKKKIMLNHGAFEPTSVTDHSGDCAKRTFSYSHIPVTTTKLQGFEKGQKIGVGMKVDLATTKNYPKTMSDFYFTGSLKIIRME